MKATVLVHPKEGILDPQGEAVLGALRHLDFAVDEVRIGRVVDIELEAKYADQIAYAPGFAPPASQTTGETTATEQG